MKQRRKKNQEPVHERKATTDFLLNAQLAPVEVKNPHDPDGGNIIVLASTRDDILRRLKAAESIDVAQFAAGRKWEADWQRAQLGQVISSQFQQRVDGGGISGDILTDQQREAQKRLAQADRALGQIGCAIIRDILGRGLTTTAAAIKYRGKATDKTEKYIAVRFRECLEVLVIVYGLKTQARG